MITLKKMKWSNLFSYGENNQIDFSENPLTQIVGYNGHGKTSIALVLEEVLYNKNSKGIKKADILNRNSTSKSYSIELWFEKDGVPYHIKTTRGSTQTVKLTCNGEDISSHTATGTYKTIEEIIGYDHKTFTQIVYQSSAASLEFLTATDSNRKKFLIDLLDLSKYVEYGDIFKQALKEVETELAKAESSRSTVYSWIEKYQSTSLTPMALVDVPSTPSDLSEKIAGLKESLKTIDSTNKRIIQNNKYKELRDAIVVELPGKKPELDTSKLIGEKAENAKTVKDSEAFILKMRKLGSSCPTCLQSIDKTTVEGLISEHTSHIESSQEVIDNIAAVLKKYEEELQEWNRKAETKTKYEEYHSLYDPEMSSEILDRDAISDNIKDLEAELLGVEKQIKEAAIHNTKATQHNTKIDIIKAQLEENQQSLNDLDNSIKVLTDKIGTLQVLVKTFSSTGLVAYKIECLIKDLEDVTNHYLQELSGGRFQIGFKVNSSDKLNVVITDNGKDIEMSALSGGERARVNCAALLGIRKLMQSLSNSRINLLVLDETIENLDLDGKEKLVEVLLSEPHLHTFIISHGFTHPLLAKLQVVKENNISRIENG